MNWTHEPAHEVNRLMPGPVRPGGGLGYHGEAGNLVKPTITIGKMMVKPIRK